MRTTDLRKALDSSVTLHRSLLRYAHAFLNRDKNRGREMVGPKLRSAWRDGF